ncbi:MAG: hypothetical protein IIT78_01700 [Mycoplasmataceae bacterium]|nr:hypothetical protein [Mycoplasmataceae bacterium]
METTAAQKANIPGASSASPLAHAAILIDPFKQLKPNAWIELWIYMNQITVKIYELNMQNTKQLLIQQNDD